MNHTLPAELWFHIFGNVNNTTELGQSRLVCKLWNYFAEISILTMQITVKTHNKAIKFYEYLKKKPEMALHVKHLTFEVPQYYKSTSKHGPAFLKLLRLAMTHKINIIDGNMGMDSFFIELLKIVESSPSSFDRLKMIPIPTKYNHTYRTTVIGLKNILQGLILDFTSKPFDWDLIYRLGEFKRLTFLTLTGDAYNITLTDSILKKCGHLQELSIDVKFSDPIVLNTKTVRTWSSRNVKKINSLKKLRFGLPCRPDLFEYLAYKYPNIQNIQLTIANFNKTRSLINEYTGHVKYMFEMFPTCDIHCSFHKRDNVEFLVKSLKTNHNTVIVENTSQGCIIHIKFINHE